MKTPQWLTEEVARHGADVLDGSASRAGALAALTAVISGHPECIADLAAAYAERELAKWLRANIAGTPTSSQLLLFPEMPLRMRVAPDKSIEVAAMTSADLDHAKNMLWARTKNQIKGAKEAAEHEREVFTDFYDQVHPLLTGDLVVADILIAIERAA